MTRKIKGLYAITPDLADTQALLSRVEAALQGGISLLQYRNKPASPALRHAQADALLLLCRQYGVPLIINDFPELCLAVEADGVHIGGTDGALAEARALLGPDKIIGVSCYNQLALAIAAANAGADYVAFGACFGSSTKPNAPVAALELFSQLRAHTDVPAVAIGGITVENANVAMEAGADALAVIHALFAAPDVKHAAQNFVRLFNQTHVS